MDLVARLRSTGGYFDEAALDNVSLAECADEIERLRMIEARVAAAPVAIMDTRDALGICAPTEDAFQALYALQGKRVRLVVDEVPNY